MTISMRGSPAGAGDSPADAPVVSGQGQGQQGLQQQPAVPQQPPPSPQQSPLQPPQQLSPTPSTSVEVHDAPSITTTVSPEDAPPQQLPVQHDETGQGDGTKDDAPGDGDETVFPTAELARLDEMISRPRWVVPVLPNGELEVLLKAAIELCRKGMSFG